MKIKKIKFPIGIVALMFSGAALGQTQVPNDFTAGTPARAAEVNANFDALETAIDQNASDIQSIPAGPQGDPGPTGPQGLQGPAGPTGGSGFFWKAFGNSSTILDYVWVYETRISDGVQLFSMMIKIPDGLGNNPWLHVPNFDASLNHAVFETDAPADLWYVDFACVGQPYFQNPDNHPLPYVAFLRIGATGPSGKLWTFKVSDEVNQTFNSVFRNGDCTPEMYSGQGFAGVVAHDPTIWSYISFRFTD